MTSLPLGIAALDAAAFPTDLARPLEAFDASRPTADAEPILALEGISLSFGGVAALSNVDIAIRSGEIFAIIGPNGAGKSSIVNIICGVYRPDNGRVRLDGIAYRQMPTRRLAALGIARTFQNLALFKGLSVLDNVVAGRAHLTRSSFAEQIVGLGRARREAEEARSRANEVIEFLHLGAVRDRPAGTLPYGIQKRVELARALVARPKLLLLDEPMAGMTVAEKGEMACFVRNAQQEYGMSVVLIEHDIGVVMGLSDRVAVLDHGVKIADGTPAEVQANQAVIDAYLGVAHDDAHDEEGAL